MTLAVVVEEEEEGKGRGLHEMEEGVWGRYRKQYKNCVEWKREPHEAAAA